MKSNHIFKMCINKGVILNMIIMHLACTKVRCVANKGTNKDENGVGYSHKTVWPVNLELKNLQSQT